jgi:hemolysin D
VLVIGLVIVVTFESILNALRAYVFMLIDGKRIPLSPGMNITAEIKTGKRRIIEYLLSPVQRAGSESLRKR